MSNIIIKSDARRQHEAYVLESFKRERGGRATTAADRDAAAVIAARTHEAYKDIRKMEGKKHG